MPNTCASRRLMRWDRPWTAPPTWALNVSSLCVCQMCFFLPYWQCLPTVLLSFCFCSIPDAPDDISVSESIVYVQERQIPGRVICKSQANPGKWIANSVCHLLHSRACIPQNPSTSGCIQTILSRGATRWLSTIPSTAMTPESTDVAPSISTEIAEPKQLLMCNVSWGHPIRFRIHIVSFASFY